MSEFKNILFLDDQGSMADSMKVIDLEKQIRQKDEYIAELEARIVKEDGEMKQHLATVVAYNQAQTIEIQNLKKQLEGMREIMMSKDEAIMKLKNDLPIKPKQGPGQDRFENMFMTSLELEAHKKKLTGEELQLRLQELELLVTDQQRDIQELTTERNNLEKELLDHKHKVDDLEEINKDYSNANVTQLEEQLRDAKCKIEELSEGKDSGTLAQEDSSMMEKLLKEAEIKLHQTTEQLQLSQQQLLYLSTSYQQLQASQNQSKSEEADSNELASLKSKLEAAENSLNNMNGEQEDLLGNIILIF